MKDHGAVEDRRQSRDRKGITSPTHRGPNDSDKIGIWKTWKTWPMGNQWAAKDASANWLEDGCWC